NGFTSISDGVKNQIGEINEILISNLNFEVDAVVKKISDLQKSLKLDVEKANAEKAKVTTPKTPVAPTTSAPKPAPAPAPKPSEPAKSSTPSKSSLPLVKQKFATPKGGWDKLSVVDFLKSKGYRAEFNDRMAL